MAEERDQGKNFQGKKEKGRFWGKIRREEIRGMMLLDLKYDPDLATGGLSQKETDLYESNLNKTAGSMKFSILASAREYLAVAGLGEKDMEMLVKREFVLAFLLYLADEAQDEEIPPDVFGNWWKQYEKGDEFKRFYENVSAKRGTGKELSGSLIREGIKAMKKDLIASWKA